MNDITQAYTEVVSEKQEGVTTNYYYGNKRIQSNQRIYVYDGMGNVIQDISPSGALLESYEYSAYGERNIQYNPFLKNSSYGYRGEAHTYDNKQYLRARYYDVHSENFIQEDSYRGTQDDVASRNRYNYAQNNPYKYSDPSGHDAMSALGVGGGGNSGGFKFVSIVSLTATLLGVDTVKAYQAGCKEVLLYNNKLYTGKHNGANYVGGIKQKSTSGGSGGSSGSSTVPDSNTNYYIQDDIIVATFTPTVIKADAPKLDMSKLNEVAQAKVKDTAKALNVPEEILRQFLQADLGNDRSLFERTLSDRVIGLCDDYLKAVGKSSDNDVGTLPENPLDDLVYGPTAGSEISAVAGWMLSIYRGTYVHTNFGVHAGTWAASNGQTLRANVTVKTVLNDFRFGCKNDILGVSGRPDIAMKTGDYKAAVYELKPISQKGTGSATSQALVYKNLMESLSKEPIKVTLGGAKAFESYLRSLSGTVLGDTGKECKIIFDGLESGAIYYEYVGKNKNPYDVPVTAPVDVDVKEKEPENSPVHDIGTPVAGGLVLAILLLLEPYIQSGKESADAKMKELKEALNRYAPPKTAAKNPPIIDIIDGIVNFLEDFFFPSSIPEEVLERLSEYNDFTNK